VFSNQEVGMLTLFFHYCAGHSLEIAHELYLIIKKLIVNFHKEATWDFGRDHAEFAV
jgi:hypothetical protein